MILGVGIDLVEVGRIRDSLERLGERFARRILCPAEYDYCFSHTDPSTHVAARFAAKEAVSKAFGNPQHAFVFSGEFHANVLPEGGRTAAYVYRDVKDRALCHAD